MVVLISYVKRIIQSRQVNDSDAMVDDYWMFDDNIWFLPKVWYNWLAVVWWNKYILQFANALNNNNVYVAGPLFTKQRGVLP